MLSQMSEHPILDRDVEVALSDNESKYNSDSSSTDENCSPKKSDLQENTMRSSPNYDLQQLTRKLFEEFDSLGVCELKEHWNSKTNDPLDLVANTFKLVNIHRKLLTQMNESNIAYAKLKADSLRLEKQVDTFKKTIMEKDDVINNLNRKFTLAKLDCEDLQKDKLSLQQDIRYAKIDTNAKEDEWEHKIKQLQMENQTLRDINEKNIGNFTSKDEIVATVIQKYRLNEEHYKKTIKKLQDNNQELVKQLLDLVHLKGTSSIPK